MKLPKIISVLAIAALFTGGFAFADDAKKEEGKAAACCAKAAEAGKDCTHACCTEAAAAGKNCAKCGGSGMAAAKK
jgi:hypothetical protein